MNYGSGAATGEPRAYISTLGYSTWEQYVALERILEPPTDVARDVDAELLAPLRRLLWEACASNEKS